MESSGAPSALSLAAAFFVTPAVTSAALSLFMPLYAGVETYFEQVWRTAIVYGLFAYGLAFVLGVPALLLLLHRVRFRALNCALTGSIVVALPWLMLVVFGPIADQASSGGRATVINGSRTAYGHLQDLQFVGLMAVIGLIAGAAFWLIASAVERARG